MFGKIKTVKSRIKNIKSIYSIDEFHAIVAYERSRCDRENTFFSVLMIHDSKLNEKRQTDLYKCVSGIKKILRGIDHLGWWAEDTLAVLLPSTDGSGAQVCSSKIRDYLSTFKVQSKVSVFCYPHHWLEDGFCEPADVTDGCENDTITFEKVFTPGIPIWKRALDLFGSSIGLILLSPLLLSVIGYIKLVSPGRAFFIQKRIGYRGKEFNFYKFRTMHEGNNQAFHGKHATQFIQNADMPMVKLDDVDPRIIPGGKILRKLCIDEVPQLINVFRGEMSLVGPRPCIPYEKEAYLQWHTHRFDVIPGMTGLWQVSGKNKLTFKQMIRLDIAYCRNLSIFSDIKILLLTIPAIIKMVYESASASVNKEDKAVPSYSRLNDMRSRSS